MKITSFVRVESPARDGDPTFVRVESPAEDGNPTFVRVESPAEDGNPTFVRVESPTEDGDPTFVRVDSPAGDSTQRRCSTFSVNALQPLILIGFLLGLFACTTPPTNTLQLCEGITMGTQYHVKYHDTLQRNFQAPIDSILIAVNLSLSTYIDTSAISRINKAPDSLVMFDKHLENVWQKAKQVNAQTQGSFDPTVMPIVNYWGFGYSKKDKAGFKPDSAQVDSLLQFVGIDKIQFGEWKQREVNGMIIQLYNIKKSHSQVQIDLSAIAKGYGVDVVANWLAEQGIKDYMVEIGGEVRTKGRFNAKDTGWPIGINRPMEGAALTDLEAIVNMQDMAMATSGNYRNYYEKDGKKYVHTINPSTGYPEISNLLSASVLAPDCMTADAFATACMVMGLERAKSLAKEIPAIEVYLIYSDDAGKLQTYASEGFKQYLVKEKVK